MISEDHEILAAEYALGTLDESERAQAVLLVTADDEFAARVRYWETRLASLTAMVGPVEPPAAIWDRIVVRIRDEARNTETAPSSSQSESSATASSAAVVADSAAATSAAAASAESTATTGGADIIDLTARLRRWRTATYAAGAIAASLLLFVGVREMSPRPQPAGEAGRFVAVLQRDAVSPGFLLTVDLKSKNFTVRRVGADTPAERSYELWLVHDKFPQPRSLGVIGAQPFTRAGLSEYDQNIINEATYAVSLEPPGGSPTGVATGPIVYVGKLVEAVP